MKKTLAFTFIVMILLMACTKEKTEASLKSKWTLENTVSKEYLNGTLANTITLPGGGTTLDFQNNGNVVITYPGSPVESFPYTLQPGSKVEFDSDTYEIRDLTNSTVTLYIRYDYAPGEYDETFLNLKK
jgi:hypothetical protein